MSIASPVMVFSAIYAVDSPLERHRKDRNASYRFERSKRRLNLAYEYQALANWGATASLNNASERADSA